MSESVAELRKRVKELRGSVIAGTGAGVEELKKEIAYHETARKSAERDAKRMEALARARESKIAKSKARKEAAVVEKPKAEKKAEEKPKAVVEKKPKAIVPKEVVPKEEVLAKNIRVKKVKNAAASDDE